MTKMYMDLKAGMIHVAVCVCVALIMVNATADALHRFPLILVQYLFYSPILLALPFCFIMKSISTISQANKTRQWGKFYGQTVMAVWLNGATIVLYILTIWVIIMER